MHGFSKTHPLSEGLESVRSYLSNTQDIVLFCVSTTEFGLSKSFPEEAYTEFDNLLLQASGDWWVKPDVGGEYAMKLADIWNQPGLNQGEGRIFITYKVSTFNTKLCIYHFEVSTLHRMTTLTQTCTWRLFPALLATCVTLI